MTMETVEVLNVIREDLRGLGTPWRDRKGAAAYLGVSTGTIDKLAGMGVLKRQYVLSEPRYHVKDLDKAIRDTAYKLDEVEQRTFLQEPVFAGREE